MGIENLDGNDGGGFTPGDDIVAGDLEAENVQIYGSATFDNDLKGPTNAGGGLNLWDLVNDGYWRLKLEDGVLKLSDNVTGELPDITVGAGGGGGTSSVRHAVFTGSGNGVGTTDTNNATVDTLTVYDADGVDISEDDSTFGVDESGYPQILVPGIYTVEARFAFSATLSDNTLYTMTFGLGPQYLGQFVPTGVNDRSFIYGGPETARVASTLTLAGIHVSRSVNSWGVVTFDPRILVTKIA